MCCMAYGDSAGRFKCNVFHEGRRDAGSGVCGLRIVSRNFVASHQPPQCNVVTSEIGSADGAVDGDDM